MNEKAAFEAWFAANFEPHDKATTYGLTVVEEAWQAALEWARTQQEPVASTPPPSDMQRERYSAFDTLPDDYETGDY